MSESTEQTQTQADTEIPNQGEQNLEQKKQQVKAEQKRFLDAIGDVEPGSTKHEAIIDRFMAIQVGILSSEVLDDIKAGKGNKDELVAINKNQQMRYVLIINHSQKRELMDPVYAEESARAGRELDRSFTNFKEIDPEYGGLSEMEEAIKDIVREGD